MNTKEKKLKEEEECVRVTAFSHTMMILNRMMMQKNVQSKFVA